MKISFLNCCIGLLSLGSCSDSGNPSVDKSSSDVSSNGAQTASATGSVGPATASSAEVTSSMTNSSSSTSGGAVGFTAGASSSTMMSGVTTSSAVGGGGSGNAGADLTPEELRDATYDECAVACVTENEACPSIAQENCFGSCSSQADGALTSGSCGLELYQALYCINRQLEISDIRCPSSPGGAPMFDGCLEEQVRYADCS